MDRSSFTFKGSTHDFEKRQEFKANLANRIEPPKTKALPPIDNTFNGVSPGGKLVHPSLGEGTLVEVNHDNNEVVIDFGTKGLIGLVLSQAKSFVHAPTKEITKGIAGNDDAFLGSEIQSRIIAPQDRDFREVDFTRVVSPDFVEPKKTFYPVGSSVWHSELGVCTVSFVNEAANTILLTTKDDDKIDLVLSQVRSKLRAIEDVVEHVPTKPLVREQLGQRFPTYSAHGEVDVRLPEVFKTWSQQQQFMYLTRSQPSLTTEQANDVFSVLAGKDPMFYSVTINWQTPEETKSLVTSQGVVTDAGVRPQVTPMPSVHEMSDKRFWHPDFGECSVSAYNELDNELILQTSIGLKKFVMDVTLPNLALMTEAKVEHAPKQLGSKPQVVKAPVVKDPIPEVKLPQVFKSWKPVEQYQYLTHSCHLSPENANEVLAGNLPVIWTDELPESNKRAEFKSKLSVKVEKAGVEPVIQSAPAPTESGTKRYIEEEVFTRKDSITKLSVDLPTDFKNWTSSGQYVFLTRSRQLTFNEANDIMDSLQGKPVPSSTQYELNWQDVDAVAYTDSGVRRFTEEVDVVEKKPVLKKIAVTLPTDFKNWSESKQFSFLTRARQLTINETNDVLNTYRDVPFSSKIQYEINWSE